MDVMKSHEKPKNGFMDRRMDGRQEGGKTG